MGRPHGLDGSFHVVDASPGLLGVGASVRVDVGASVRVDARDLRIVRRAGTDERPIVRLEGFEDRAAAESLRGRELLVARSAARELEPEEWWAEDLVGCRVHDAGRPVGTVARLLALPSCEVLEVERDPGPGTLLVPLVADAVREVDPVARAIEVDLRFLGES
ncbi:MAG: 16S rRNA processing protein RimM [Solirubrobacterales bacterium]|nr:16S rRNA processing protein RimM [Solirubrobacterales bacterium]MBV9716094.1 16S rRNA processing protein RimM [Solirubrobacterales bacterium]